MGVCAADRLMVCASTTQAHPLFHFNVDLVLGLQREHVAAPPTKIQGPLITKFSETLYHLGKIKLTTIHTILSSQNIFHTLLHTRKKMFSRMSQLYLFLSTPLTVEKKQSTQTYLIHPLR